MALASILRPAGTCARLALLAKLKAAPASPGALHALLVVSLALESLRAFRVPVVGTKPAVVRVIATRVVLESMRFPLQLAAFLVQSGNTSLAPVKGVVRRVALENTRSQPGPTARLVRRGSTRATSDRALVTRARPGSIQRSGGHIVPSRLRKRLL